MDQAPPNHFIQCNECATTSLLELSSLFFIA
jgi:hypothetical protein